MVTFKGYKGRKKGIQKVSFGFQLSEIKPYQYFENLCEVKYHPWNGCTKLKFKWFLIGLLQRYVCLGYSYANSCISMIGKAAS